MSNKFASQFNEIRIFTNKKNEVDARLQETIIIYEYWKRFIDKINILKIDDVPPISYTIYGKPHDRAFITIRASQVRLIEDFNIAVFDLQKSINDLKKTDNSINVRAASKLQRMLNNFTAATTADRKEIGVFNEIKDEKSSYIKVAPIRKVPNIINNGLPKVAMHLTFYKNGKHTGLANVINFMYKAFPETNLSDIDTEMQNLESESNKYLDQIVTLQNMITRQGGDFNFETPPNINDARSSITPANSSSAKPKTTITPLQKGLIVLTVFITLAAVGITIFKRQQ